MAAGPRHQNPSSAAAGALSLAVNQEEAEYYRDNDGLDDAFVVFP